MAKKILLEIVTPEKIVLSREVDSLIVPAAEGYLGILPGHAPLVSQLDTGVASVKVDGEVEKMAVCCGFIEVVADKVTLLCDVAELAEEIDVERALRAKKRAEERIAKKGVDVDLIRAEAALKRSLARLGAAGRI
ncbi:MAG: F0F1 ATP synthase subunit epsilon [Bacillota bacterium]